MTTTFYKKTREDKINWDDLSHNGLLTQMSYKMK